MPHDKRFNKISQFEEKFMYNPGALLLLKVTPLIYIADCTPYYYLKTLFDYMMNRIFVCLRVTRRSEFSEKAQETGNDVA